MCKLPGVRKLIGCILVLWTWVSFMIIFILLQNYNDLKTLLICFLLFCRLVHYLHVYLNTQIGYLRRKAWLFNYTLLHPHIIFILYNFFIVVLFIGSLFDFFFCIDDLGVKSARYVVFLFIYLFFLKKRLIMPV